MPRQKVKIDIAKVEELAGRGLSYDQIAASLGIGTKTLFRHRQSGDEMTELTEAIKRGRAKGLEEATNMLWDKMNEGNLGAIIFYLKARGGWQETHRTELTGANGSPVEIQDNTKFAGGIKVKFVRPDNAGNSPA